MENEIMTKMNEKRACRLGSRSGFTFIEIMLVIAIIAILAGVAAVATGGRTKKARVAAARADIDAIGLAIDTYEIDNGKYPSGLQNLLTSSGEPGWDGPYLKKTDGVPVDPWGNAYQFQAGDKTYTLTSAGPDGSFGSEDDVTN
jgi:general secretion pathway protein G